MNLAEMYREGRLGMIEFGRSLTDDDASTVVPGCPEWTIKDVYAHQAGVVADALAGRLDGVATDPWTARQVAERATASLADVLDEWEQIAPGFEAILESGAGPPQVIIDQWSHEQDMRAALGRPGNRGDARAQFSADVLAGRFESWAHPAVVLIGDTGRWTIGDGDPKITLRASDYDLARALLGRRSRAQVLAMDWDGDPEPFLDELVVFAFAEHDQPA